MNRLASVLVLATLGCGGAPPATDSAMRSDPPSQRETSELRSRLSQCEQRVAALETEDAEREDQLRAQMEAIAAKLTEVEDKLKNRPGRPSRPQPDPAVVYAVPVEGSPSVGANRAWVTIVKGFEFACPFCDRSRTTIETLKKKYGRDLRIVYKHFIVHPSEATLPAIAACAADRQGKFSKMYKLLFERGFPNRASGGLGRENLSRLAKQAGLNTRTFNKDMRSKSCEEKVRQDQEELARLGMSGTPSFYINGRFLSGARPAEQFEKIIDEELAKAKASNIPRARYYQHLVETGKSEL